MTAKRFKFVSPGVKINEIDRSVLTANNGAIGPVVIGKFQRGPGLVPVTVEDYIKFDAAFGSPTRGVVNSTKSDVWRTGQQQSPTYAAYAAEAWLKNSAPLTAVRVLGVQHDNATVDSDARAGWKADGGAVGIFLSPSGSSVTGALAAVIYLTEGSVEVDGTDVATGLVQTSGSNTFVKTIGNDFEFRIVIKDAGGNPVKDTAVNLNKSSAKYIRKALNTNPVLTNVEIVPTSVQKTYWLGETFDTFVKSVVADSTTGDVLVCTAPLSNSTLDAGDHLNNQAQPAKSGWVVAQDLNSVTGSFEPAEMPKLFRLSTLGGETGDSSGEWEQKNVKVSVEDIKPSNNPYNKYGSFTIKVRKISDTDKKQEVLETFSNLNLDPTSENYVAKVIGDKKLVWNSTLSRHEELGSFENRSNYIRVEMDQTLEEGGLDPELLPFGFFGIPKFVNALSNGTASTLFSGSVSTGGVNLTASFAFPTLPMVVTASRSLFNTHLGLDASIGKLFNEDILDLVRMKPNGFDSYVVSGSLVEDSVVFTLDDVSGSTVSDTAGVWAEGSRKLGQSLTAQASGSEKPYASVLEKVNSFTMPLFGGTDGLRITEKNPLRNTFLMQATDPEGKDNYALYSVKRAIDCIAEPEVLDMNLLVVPGVTNTILTDRAIEVCETRADSMAIIDVEGGYITEAENDQPEVERLGSVQEVISEVKAREFNTSYACTYYPWVKIRDQRESGDVWVPPSVVALGTMASSQEVSAVWFAPAGFNRGGLDRGSSGLNVIQVREVLKATQRDDLYEVNINPIARFPAEGIVIFGQKTLQATPSALDRINVRRMVLFLKKQVSRIASGLLFDQNIKTTWQRFLNQVNPLMESVKSGGGLADFKVVLDETTTTPDLIDRNTMYAKIFIKPAYAIEFIAIDFIITNSGASFDDL